MRIHSYRSVQIALATALVVSVAVVVNHADPVAAGEVGSDDFQISTSSPQPTESRVAFNATDDQLLAVWTSVDGALEPRIHGQLLDATDGSKVGGEFLIAELNGGDPTTGYIEPAVAWNSTANEYVVVFSGDDTTDTGLITTTFEIYARRVSAAGTPLGVSPTRISDMGTDDTNGSFDAREPDIAYDSDTNSYLVVWEGDDDTAPLVNGELEIFGQLLAADLTESGGDVRLSDMGIDGSASSDARSPSVAFLPGASARYLVVWEGDDDSMTFEIHGQYVSTAGAEIGADFLVSTEPTNDEAYAPDVAADSTTGQFMAVWEHDNGAGNDFEVDGALLSTTGVTSVFDVSESGDASWIVNTPAVAYNATLDLFSVVWVGDYAGLTAADEYEVIHVLLDATTGAAAQPVERISTMGVDGVPLSAVTHPDVAPAAGGTSAAVWSAVDPPASTDSEVWGQLLGRSADLSITKTLTSASNPGPGDTVTYTIAYANAGPGDATDVRIVDPIPTGFDVVSAVASDPTLVPDLAETLAWDLPSLPSGDSGTILLTLTVNGDAVDGQVIVNTASIAAEGLAGDPNATNDSSNAAPITVDFPPSVTIDQGASQADPTNAGPIVFDVVFSEPVAGFDSPGDVVVGGDAPGTLSAAITSVSSTDYTVAVSGMTGDGTVTATIPAGAANDAAGKPSTASTSTDNEVTLDATAPTVTIDQAVGQADPTDVGPIEFTIVFSEDVIGFGSGDVTIDSTAGPVTGAVSGGPDIYSLSMSGMTTNGTVTASIAAGAATDAAGNSSAASTSTDNVVTYTVNVAPDLQNLAITPVVDENGTATLTGDIVDPDVGDTFTLSVDWGDGTSESVDVLSATSFELTHQFLDDDPTGTASDQATVVVSVVDSAGDGDSDSVVTTVTNLNPVLSNLAITDVNEDGVATLTGNIADVGTLDSFTLEVDWGDSSPVSTYSYPAGTTAFSETHHYLDDNPSGTASDPYTVSLTLTDDDTGSDTDSVVTTVTNLNPVLSASAASTFAQYSDATPSVVVTGVDVAGDPMLATTSWSVNGGGFVSGLPVGLTVSSGPCTVVDNTRTCTWALTSEDTLAAGVYVVSVSVDDDDLGTSTIDITLSIAPEDAAVTFDAANPVAVQVTEDGGNSGLFTLTLQVQETQPDLGVGPAPGDINLAQVEVTLQPVGPGSPKTGTCVSTGEVGAFDYDSILTVKCDFDDVPVNTYNVIAGVVGGYYTGTTDDVLTVFDPSLGFTTGGGTYTDGNGDRVNFGYTMKYNKKRTNVQGSLLVIRHTPDGVYRLKSNKIEGLALGSATDFSWASFTGKATYQEPGWADAIGNYEFVAYVEDHGTPGAGADRFWVTAIRDGELATGLSLLDTATKNARTLTGGNIVVPHQGGRGGGTKQVL
jgi:uncharacterized repeat protein (TIGR01451 family)